MDLNNLAIIWQTGVIFDEPPVSVKLIDKVSTQMGT